MNEFQGYALADGVVTPGRRQRFERDRRLHLPGVLQPAGAEALHAALTTTTEWERTLTDRDREIDVPPAELAALSAEAQVALHRGVYEKARSGFAYLFETIRISGLSEAGRALDPAFQAIYRWLNGPEFLGAVAELSGDDRGVYVDCQATRYLPGFFLTGHDDEKGGKDRLFAYVLNLSPEWRAEWGGLLLFHDQAGNVAEGYTPAFNALNLFAVPQRHSVSLVTPSAGGARLSITGWIRSKRPD